MDKKLKEDLLTSYEILEDMHNSIMANELFTTELIEEAETAISYLKLYDLTDAEQIRAVNDTVELLEDELKLNEKIKLNREKIISRTYLVKGQMNHV